MKDFIICYIGLALAAALVVLPIVLACLVSPVWLLLLIVTFPFAWAFYAGASEM